MGSQWEDEMRDMFAIGIGFVAFATFGHYVFEPGIQADGVDLVMGFGVGFISASLASFITARMGR